ncbi:MAG: hypothetical protein ACLR5H_11515 [Oscillospiraceae bacterium]
MEIKLTEKQFRRLLDLVYIGNWVLNSTRGDDRIRQYDQVESLIFSHCLSHGMAGLTELYQGEIIPPGPLPRAASMRPSWPMRTTRFSRFWPRSWPCGIWTIPHHRGEL